MYQITIVSFYMRVTQTNLTNNCLWYTGRHQFSASASRKARAPSHLRAPIALGSVDCGVSTSRRLAPRPCRPELGAVSRRAHHETDLLQPPPAPEAASSGRRRSPPRRAPLPGTERRRRKARVVGTGRRELSMFVCLQREHRRGICVSGTIGRSRRSTI